MKIKNLILLAMAVAVMLLVVGCGSGDQKTEAAATPAAEATADHPVEVAETHDCDGTCGMKAVPMDHLTQIDGKYYCAGCANKVKDAAEGEAKDAAEGHGNG